MDSTHTSDLSPYDDFKRHLDEYLNQYDSNLKSADNIVFEECGSKFIALKELRDEFNSLKLFLLDFVEDVNEKPNFDFKASLKKMLSTVTIGELLILDNCK